jgi:microsomal dipeptidase-like Zn-dependent dipeptidase
LGADYDGASIVKDLGDVADPRLFEALMRDHAWTAEDIAKLAGGNILR